MPPAEEPLVPFTPSRERVAPLTAVRSTLISSSLLQLRARGYEERYFAELAPEHREAISYTPAGVWMPAAQAEAHYGACDRMHLATHEILEIGNEVAKLTQKSVLAMILRLAKGAGTTPWALFANVDKYWMRIFQGSGVAVFKLGPKEARFEVAGCALARSSYWCVGLRGLLTSVTLPFTQKVYLRDIPHLASPTTCAFRISWV